tara:strand:- start:2418 stop:2732 length:315 start_codon:yes stop_codon:yes gene_type:complete
MSIKILIQPIRENISSDLIITEQQRADPRLMVSIGKYIAAEIETQMGETWWFDAVGPFINNAGPWGDAEIEQQINLAAREWIELLKEETASVAQLGSEEWYEDD